MNTKTIFSALAQLTQIITEFAHSHAIPTTIIELVNTTLLSDHQKHELGDITTNAAMVFGKYLKVNPATIGQELLDVITANTDAQEYISATTLVKPGFINITLKEAIFLEQARYFFAAQSTQPFAIVEAEQKPYSYNIEFVSANPTGPLHLGHGRGGIIGNTLAHILRYCGYQATQEFYINDAGNQINKLGQSLKIRYLQKLHPSDILPMPEDGYQGEYLVAIAEQLVQENKDALANKEDSYFAQIAKDQLLAYQQETLRNYGIEFDVWFSEKTLHASNAIQQAIESVIQAGHTYTTEDGTLWFASTKFGDDKDRVLRKSNGELTYVAADFAYLQNKKNRGFNKLVMILGQDHHGYVNRMKAAMQALGYNPEDLDIILYQLVTLKECGEQVRMSKRAGKIVELADVVEAVTADVARFFYLNKKADAHLEFDIALALSQSEENPVFYIQYAYVRIESILKKAAQHSPLTAINTEDLQILSSDERLIIKKILELHTLLWSITHNYQTHLLSYYTTEIARLLHSYYTNHKVIDIENIATSRHRIAFLMIIQATCGLCLDLLGISKKTSM